MHGIPVCLASAVKPQFASDNALNKRSVVIDYSMLLDLCGLCLFFWPIMLYASILFKSPYIMLSVFPIMLCGFTHHAHKKAFSPTFFADSWLFSQR